MKIFVTGGTGTLGRALIPALSARDHEVVLLTRDPHKHEAFTINPRVWLERGDPLTSGPWQRAVDGADVVIHLAAASFFEAPWSASRRSLLLSSRERATREVVRAIQEAARKPRLLLSASAVGVYGDSTDTVDERTPVGEGFLAGLCGRWEEEARVAEAATNVVVMRFGQLVGARSHLNKLPGASALPAPDATPFSWIHPTDAAGAVMSLMRSARSMTVNVTAPSHTDVASLHDALGFRQRKSLFTRLRGAGRAASEANAPVTVLAGQRVSSSRLATMGYNFRYSRLTEALSTR